MAHRRARTANCHLFILQAAPAAILRLDLESGQIKTILADLTGVPDSIQVDVQGNALYWTNMGEKSGSGESFAVPDGAIERCDLDGRNHAVLIGFGMAVTPKQLQLNNDSGQLYWCDREGMAVMRCDKDGSKLTTLLRTGRFPDNLEDALRHCVGIAVDRRNDYLYWTQKAHPGRGLGRIFRMRLDRPDGMSPENRSDAELLIDHLPEPIWLDIDHDRNQIYWTDHGNLTGGSNVNRADITAEGLKNREILATGLQERIEIGLDFERRRIFIGDASGTISTLAIDGGELVAIHCCSGPVASMAFLRQRVELD